MSKKSKTTILLSILIVSGLLRLWRLDKVPISLFSDELDVGYQAYSVLKTGRDYFGNLLPLNFQSYADFRAPLYIYSSIPTVFIFGINAWGVRLPAAIFGTLGVFFMYLFSKELFKYIPLLGNKKKVEIVINHELLALISAFLLAISPWHIQYSRAGFEVSELLFFYLLGFYLFFKFLNKGRSLWISVIPFSLTIYTYSIAKLFTPLLFVFLFIVWRKEIIKTNTGDKLKAIILTFLICLPMLISTFFGSSNLRFNYISIFTDPTTNGELQNLKLNDARMRAVYGGGLIRKVESRLIHNKVVFWKQRVFDNYLKTFSSEFLFLAGDPNLRHSINKVGQFYKVEFLMMLFGIVLFFSSKIDKRVILFIVFWLLVGALPSELTRDGGNHATRLILLLPAFIILIAYAFGGIFSGAPKNLRNVVLAVYLGVLMFEFGNYQHSYWVENPWYSERAWHAGYKEVVEEVKNLDSRYSKIIFSNANDDPKIFLAAYLPVDPRNWQKGLGRENIEGFGNLEHIGKYYFGQVDGEVGLEKISAYIDSNTIYIAAAREVEVNLIENPSKTPKGLSLVKSILYPSGEPAFYAFKSNETL